MTEVYILTRYNSVAIVLHWIMAIAFLGMIATGFGMEYLDLKKDFKFALIQFHKSLGVLLLVTVFFRLAWRLFTAKPPLPADLSVRDIILAHVGHWGLYVCMLVMPLSGWLMVSSSSYGLPTIVFNSFEWPHIQNLIFGTSWLESNKIVRQASGAVHFYFAIAFTALIAGHIGAVIKHYRFENVNLLKRMWWGYE